MAYEIVKIASTTCTQRRPRGENSTRLQAQAVSEGHTERAHSEPNEQQSDERKQSMQKGSHLKRDLLPLAQRFLWFFENHISDQMAILF